MHSQRLWNQAVKKLSKQGKQMQRRLLLHLLNSRWGGEGAQST